MSLALELGFGDPVLDSQETFRAVMNALSQPGTVHSLPSRLTPPSPLTPELAAIALTLADHEAPLWLDAALAAAPPVAEYLRFHTGANIVADPKLAAFALVAAPTDLPPLNAFALGLPDYPDRSTTVVLALDSLGSGEEHRLVGPGIRGRATLRASALPSDFRLRWVANHALFPRGVDLVLTSPGQVAGLPRSTMILEA
jgi:alpha-D-ribose 1-methylphosphonate 5-triphosphate synthase subunit PhnH